MLGPWIDYARFATRQALAADLLADPPASGVCVYGTEVVVDGLDHGQFAELCDHLGGEVIDGTVGIPATAPGSPTINNINRAVEHDIAAGVAAQRGALSEYFGSTP